MALRLGHTHGGSPERCLPDSRFTLEDQAGGAVDVVDEPLERSELFFAPNDLRVFCRLG